MRSAHLLFAVLVLPLAARAQMDAGATITPVPTGPVSQFLLVIGPRIRVEAPADITVLAVDSQYAVVTDYVGTVWFTLDQANLGVADVPAAYTFTAADQGRHTFRGGVVAHREAAFNIYVFDETGAIAGGATVTAVNDLAPIIRRDAGGDNARTATARAVVGQPWIYNAEGRISASGGTPMTFEVCGGPFGFVIEPTTGRISWTPEMAGTQFLCMRAKNSAGYDQYSFYVDVLPAWNGTAPVAALVAWPDFGPAGTDVALDASQSTTDPEAGYPRYAWRFGDGTADWLWYDPLVYHRYELPGGWNAEVRVLDGLGGESVASVPVRITDAQGQVPPLARIHMSRTSANTFAFSCDCSTDPAPTSYAWDFGNGEHRSEPTATVTYARPGRYHATLIAVAANNLSSRDSVEVIVPGPTGEVPPSCDAWVAPASSGPAPFTAYLRSTAGAGTSPIVNVQWEINGAVIGGGDIRYQFPVGYHQPVLRVTAQDGLTCTASVPIIATAEPGTMPNAIVSAPPPSPSQCGVRWKYQPAAVGTAELTWDVTDPRPDGLFVDSSTGELKWMPDPRMPAGTIKSFNLVASTPSGLKLMQPVSVVVPSCEPVVLATCGCGASGGVPALLGAALLWLTVRLRRKRGQA